MEEFEEACVIISAQAHTPMSLESIREMGEAIDRNKDGNIDINEFIEAFRIVDRFGKEMKRKSVDSDKDITINHRANGDATVIEETDADNDVFSSMDKPASESDVAMDSRSTTETRAS